MAYDYTSQGPAFTLSVTGRAPVSGASGPAPGSARSGYGDSLITARQRQFIAAGRAAARGDRTAIDAFTPLLPTTLNPFTKPVGVAPAPIPKPSPTPFFSAPKITPPAPLPLPVTPGPGPSLVPIAEVIITAGRTIATTLAPFVLPFVPNPTAPRRFDELQPDMQPVFPRPVGDPGLDYVSAPDVVGGFAEPLRDPRDDPTDSPLDVITITGRPAPGTRVDVAPDVVGIPAPRFQPAPFGNPGNLTRPATRPAPAPLPRPAPVGRPTPSTPLQVPFSPLQPFSPPTAAPGPRVVSPRPPSSPLPFVPLSPFVDPVAALPRLTPGNPLAPPPVALGPGSPLGQPGLPPANLSPPNRGGCPPCPGGGKKKDKPKKREPRKECKAGVYTQRGSKTIFTPSRIVDCVTGEKLRNIARKKADRQSSLPSLSFLPQLRF